MMFDPAIVLDAVGEIREFAGDRQVICTPRLHAFTQDSTFNTDNFTAIAGAFKVNAETFDSSSKTLSIVSDVGEIAGNTISINGMSVKIKKLEAEGELKGHVEGSLNGVAGYKGSMYSLDWPVEGSMPTIVMRHPFTGSTLVSGEGKSASIADIERYDPDLTNEKGFSKLAKKISKMLQRFLNLELSLLSNVKVLKRK